METSGDCSCERGGFEENNLKGGKADFQAKGQRSVDQQLWNKTPIGLVIVRGIERDVVCVDQREVLV